MTTAQDQQSRAELLPCPFCGGKPHVRPSQDADGCFWAWVQCGQCGARTQGDWVSSSAETCPIFYEGVRDEWNQRALPAAPLQEPDEPSGYIEATGERYYTAAQVLAMGRVLPGWQAVPMEPTSKQVVLMAGAILQQQQGTADTRHPYWPQAVEQAEQAYRAALAAAPRPPAAQERKPLAINEIAGALQRAGVETQYHTGIAGRVRWTTCGSMDPVKITRAIEAAHGIKATP